MKFSAFVLAVLVLGCGGETDSNEAGSRSQFELCVAYCTLNRSGSEATECAQSVADCPELCLGVTDPCAHEVVVYAECQVISGAGLVCQEYNDQLNPRIDYIDDACLDERARWDDCLCDALNQCEQ